MVGGGVLGLAVARELTLRHPGASVCLLEAESRLAAHQTSHSSGVVHAGVYYEPGTVRARLCVEGSAALREYCAEWDIPVDVNGKLIVATSEAEVPRLDELERRGRANGVEGLARIDGEDIGSIEPGAVGLAALHSPVTAVVDFSRVAEAFANDLEEAGGSIHLGAAVTLATTSREGLTLISTRGPVAAGRTFFC